ncbi:hypothetical protein POJ06DRAFT_259290 [Lipomyces tetrasporus]|uniref:Uncharacterized protein n=1 Tax=Lipomyces tetrasporus TaxID=54092 RepID=A0AAD7QNC7_9ASCO|nr:uncharacterized protein POJ06DRAFT_259290 [Lipomyces tetrasporus]KAJ8098369.1 hypothetical protein POJ06DRAFT_259290 [Lipomyces tetrasporus]
MPKRRQTLRSLEQTRLAVFEEVATFNHGYIRRSGSPQPQTHSQADILKYVRYSAEKENYGATLDRIDPVSPHASSSTTQATSSQTRRKKRRVVPSSDAEEYDYLSSDSCYSSTSPAKNRQRSELKQKGFTAEQDFRNGIAILEGTRVLESNNRVDGWDLKRSGLTGNELSDGYYSCSEILSDHGDPAKLQRKREGAHEVTGLDANYDLTQSDPNLEVRATAESVKVSIDSMFAARATTSLSSVGAMVTGTRGEDYIPDTFAEDDRVGRVCDENEHERAVEEDRDDHAIDDNYMDSISGRATPAAVYSPGGDIRASDDHIALQSSYISSSEWSECESLHSDTEDPDGLAGLAYLTPEMTKPVRIFTSSFTNSEARDSQDCQGASFRTNSVPSTQKPPSIYYCRGPNQVSPIRQSQSQSLRSTQGIVASQSNVKSSTPESLSYTQLSNPTDAHSQRGTNKGSREHGNVDWSTISQSDGRIENSLLTDSVMFSLPLPPEMGFNVGQSTQFQMSDFEASRDQRAEDIGLRS